MVDKNITTRTFAKSNDNPPIIITQTTLGTGNSTKKGGNDK